MDHADPRAALAAHGIRPKKRFGQHFLVQPAIARRIAQLCVTDGLQDALEVGPGTGILTAELVAAGARVRAIEIDPQMVAVLRSRADLECVDVLLGDALTFDYDASPSQAWCACGNLPYNIATPLLMRWIQAAHPPERVVVMLQNDVAARLVAQPNTAAYGSLSIAVQYTMHVRRAFTLDPHAFYPRPKVESAVVVMERRSSPPIAVRDKAFFLQVVRAGFAYRRKTLANSLGLALGIERDRVRSALAAIGLGTDARAEQLALESFGALADGLAP